MRRPYFIALLLTLATAGTYFYFVHMPVCLVPLSYRVGTLDARFNLTETKAREYLTAAEGVWEAASGRNLFEYDEDSSFAVNFVFDDRQERTIAEEAKREALDQKESTSASIGKQYKQLKEEYETKRAAFEADTLAYETKLKRFNAKVASYNAAGGAPPAEFEALKDEEKKLAREADVLEERAAMLATLANEINEVSERGNQLIAQYNAGVADYNHAFGAPDEFTQGDYQGTNINIYKFSSENELKRVLTHEFGHALGVGHVEGEASIMYYLMEKQPELPVLSTEDTAALNAVCSNKTALTNWFYRLVHRITLPTL